MNLVVHKSAFFHLDVTNQFGWYCEKVGEELSWRFFNAADSTLMKVAGQPDLGAIRRFRNPLLRGLRPIAVESPFDKFLIFYRMDEHTLEAWRLMHGARDLPRRLLEPPGFED